MSFNHVRLVMERHKLGSKHGVPIESLSHTEVSLDKSLDGKQRLVFVNPRIFHGPNGLSLCLRVQNWVLQRGEAFLCGYKPDCVEICVHTSCDVSGSFGRRDVRGRCCYCGVEYLVTREGVVTGSYWTSYRTVLAVVVIKWLGLGDGLSSTDRR